MRYLLLLFILFLPVTSIAKQLEVVTDIAPLYGLVARVMDKAGTPHLLIPAYQDPHHQVMRPSQITALRKADIVFWIGPQLTPSLQNILDKPATGSTHIALTNIAGLTLWPFRTAHTLNAHSDDTQEAHEHDDEHDEEHDEEHDRHEHDDEHEHGKHLPSDIDPHIWMDLDNARLIIDEVARQLSILDPANATLFQSNARSAKAEITAIEKTLKITIGQLHGQDIFVYHDNLQYFERFFGMKIRAALTDSDHNAMRPARLHSLQKLASQYPKACLLSESTAAREQDRYFG